VSTTRPDSEPAPATTPLGETDGATVLRGSGWGLLVAIVPAFQTLLVSVAVARLLGAEDFGRQSLIAFVSVATVSVLAARMPAALSRFGAEMLGAREGGMAITMLRWTWRVQLIAGAVAAAGFVAAALFGASPGGGWVLAGLVTWGASVQAAPSSFLVAAQRWRESILPGLLTTLGSIGAVIAVLALGGGITGYFAVEVAVVAVNLYWTARLARRLRAELPGPVPISPERRREFRSFIQASTFFAVVEFVVLSRSEVLFLQHYSGSVQVGYYSVAFAAAAAVARVPTMLTGVAMPAVATLHGSGDHDRIRVGFWRAARLLVALCPTLVAIAAVLGTDLLGIVYGSEFGDAEPVLAILLTPFVLLPVAGMADAILWIFGRMRFLVVCGSIATVADVLLAFLLIPAFGAVGAAIVNVLAQLVFGVPALLLVARLLAPRALSLRLVRNSVVVAVAVGGAGLVPIVALGGIPGILAGAVAVFLALWFVSGWVPVLRGDDAEWLVGAAGGRIGPAARVIRRASDGDR
jgi:O-antigen/teichoic acid export membrane protein